jgi:3'-phosphoadenosine 5'-phosphosulfate sulfotransferase (PAPS reductase)/FAD synthetase
MRDCNFIEEENETSQHKEVAPTTAPDLASYGLFAIGFSGGKDSWAALLHLLESGVPPEKIELHHQKVDGLTSKLMDWPCASSYVDKAGAAFGIPVYHSWKEGGFEREMLKENAKTAPVSWYTKDGHVLTKGGDRGKVATRRMFPQTSADLLVRWCSSALKIDVFARVLTNDERFQNKRVLVITGERAEESAARAHYATFEPHRADLRNGKKAWRHIDHWRPVHGWSEAEVWAILERHRVNPPPSYWLGFSRWSCRGCIFSGPNEWATLRTYMPEAFASIAGYEREFGITIHRSLTVDEQADRGVPHIVPLEVLLLAESTEYYADVILPEGTPWILPPGAFKKGNGPT